MTRREGMGCDGRHKRRKKEMRNKEGRGGGGSTSAGATGNSGADFGAGSGRREQEGRTVGRKVEGRGRKGSKDGKRGE